MHGGGTEPATAQVVQAGERRLARVESLRALAACAVMIGHWYLFAHAATGAPPDNFFARVLYGGGFGVYLFFALTGYLLFWPFVRRDLGGGTQVDLGIYARNRALRILPLYFASVLLLMVLGEPDGLRFLTLTENFSLETAGTGMNPVLWSVVVEVHFYILLPLLAYGIALVARGSIPRTIAALLALGAAGLAVQLAKVNLVEPASPLWRYNLPATFMFFVPGMLLAVLRLELEQRPRPLGSSTAWLAGGAVLWAVCMVDYDFVAVAAPAAFLTVGACVLPGVREGAVRRLLDARVLAGLGVASYSLYVWHYVIQRELYQRLDDPSGPIFFVLALGLPIVVALVSYRLIEAPFLRLRRRWSTASAHIEPSA